MCNRVQQLPTYLSIDANGCGWIDHGEQPIAVRVKDDRAQIERVRTRVGPNDEWITTDDLITLFLVTPGGLAEEAAAHGLEAEELRHIPETPEHVAAEVVIFRG